MPHRFHRLVLGLAVLTICLAAGNVQAQPGVGFGLSFGNGPVRVGIGTGPYYGPGYYGYGYRRHFYPGYGGYYAPPYYGPPPVVVQPLPVYVPQPVYIQPTPQAQPQPQTVYGLRQQSNSPTPAPMPAFTGGTTLPPSPSPMFDGGEILLFSPVSNTSDVRYTLNGHAYTMHPGSKQKFTNDRNWTIEFETTPGHWSRHTLASARYKFTPSTTGMKLHQTNDAPGSVASSLSDGPIPNPPSDTNSGDDTEATVIPTGPPLRRNP